MFSDIKLAIASYTKAWQMLHKHKMWPMVFISGLFYLLIIGGCLFGFISLSEGIYEWVKDISWIKYCQEKFSYFYIILKFLLFGVFLACFVFSFSLYKYVLLTIASPLYAYISERTHRALTGEQFDFSLKQLMHDIARGLRISLRNLVRQTFFAILLFIISFIPVVGLLSVVLLIILDSYYYGFAMLDYNCERLKMNASQCVAFIKSRPGLAIGNGFVFYLLMLIPVIGILIGAPLSVIAATVSLHESNKLQIDTATPHTLPTSR